jgi:hypothetical protein
MSKTVMVRYDELPKPVREDFLLQVKDGVVCRRELPPVLHKVFVEPEPYSKCSDTKYFTEKLYKKYDDV